MNTSSANRYYSGSFEFNSLKQLEYIHTSEGRVRYDANTQSYTYDYALKDHLGNTRVMYAWENASNSLDVLQVSNYYPFGMQFDGGSTVSNEENKYLYNGKELQDDNGLDWYDYGWRQYDAALGRWHVSDPQVEKYYSHSPYNYCINNPILIVDPNGDTITLSDAFKENKHWMKSYETWSKTSVGKKFHEQFGEGGEFGHVSINFDVVDFGVGSITEGVSSGEIIDKETGEDEESVASGKNYGKEGASLAFGKSENFLKYTFSFNSSNSDNTSSGIAGGVETITHEQQHFKIEFTHLASKAVIPSSYMQHRMMKDESQYPYFRERYKCYRQLRAYWYKSFLRQQKLGVVNNEDGYIRLKINGFRD